MLGMLANCGWNSVLCFLLDYGLCVIHLSDSNAHDLVFALVLWMFSLLSSNFSTKTLKKTLFYFIAIFEIVLACSFIVWEQFLEQTSTLDLAIISGKFPRKWQWVYINEPWFFYSTSVWLHKIYSHLSVCTQVPWSPWSLSMVLLASLTIYINDR